MKNSGRGEFIKQIPMVIFTIVCIFSVFSPHTVGSESANKKTWQNLNADNCTFYSYSDYFNLQWLSGKDSRCNNSISENDKLLFFIIRTTNPHNICYDVNLKSAGKLNVENPLDIYWIKNEDGGKRIPISWVDRTFGYGIKTISISEDQLIFQFVAYNKRNFHLKMDKGRKFRVYTSSMGKQIELSKMHIHVTGGTLLVPKISKIEVHGKDIHTGAKTLEIVTM